MIHPGTGLRFIDPVIGFGVFAIAPIPRGTITWALDPLDQVFEESRVEELGPLWQDWRDHNTFCDRDGNRILSWDSCRSMNHSCEPSCGGTDLGYEIALVDIEPGDELTNDYGTLHIGDCEGFTCCCGSPNCRRVVSPDDEATGRILHRVREALLVARKVEQPLATLLRPDWLAQALASVPATPPQDVAGAVPSAGTPP